MNLIDKKTELRRFGYAGGIFFFVLTILGEYGGGDIFPQLGAVGLIFFLSGALYPTGLALSHALLLRFSSFVNTIVTALLLTAVFYGIISPIAAVARISRKKFLECAYSPKRDTYWEENPDGQSDHCERQF